MRTNLLKCHVSEGIELDMTRERRRKILNRVVDRWAMQASTFETHPIFLAKVEDWIEGRIFFDGFRDFYGELVRSGRLKAGVDQKK